MEYIEISAKTVDEAITEALVKLGTTSDRIEYEIVEKVGELGDTGNGWKKELNIVSWNDREPVYDIRTWNETHDRMGKGITLSQDEIKTLKELLEKADI